MVAIPTGILSAGFVEEYQKAKTLADVEAQNGIHFIEVVMRANDSWVGRKINELGMPHGSLIAIITRGSETIIPYGEVKILEGDKLIICADSAGEGMFENLTEIVLHEHHPWNGQMIKELDISRQTFIVLIVRGGKWDLPTGNYMLEEGDRLLIYSKERIDRYKYEPRF
jgi:voltage-gated potassium channel